MTDSEARRAYLTDDRVHPDPIVRLRYWIKRAEAAEQSLVEHCLCVEVGAAKALEERAEAAEAKLARVRERIERNFVHTRDSLRELLNEA